MLNLQNSCMDTIKTFFILRRDFTSDLRVTIRLSALAALCSSCISILAAEDMIFPKIQFKQILVQIKLFTKKYLIFVTPKLAESGKY